MQATLFGCWAKTTWTVFSPCRLLPIPARTENCDFALQTERKPSGFGAEKVRFARPYSLDDKRLGTNSSTVNVDFVAG
jgi:hypothetical protein